MKYIVYITLATVALLLLMPEVVEAQCAMCKATAEQGDQKGLNLGILYLFLTPYTIVGTLAFLWWRNKKKSGQEAPDGKTVDLGSVMSN